MDWSCVDYLWIIVKFLFAIWDTVILMAPIQGASEEMLNFFKCVLMKKQTHPQLGWSDDE